MTAATHTQATPCSKQCACATQPTTDPVPLTSLRRGQVATICSKALSPDDAAVLRSMGFRPSARIRMCRIGEPCIVVMQCRCGDACRIGLAHTLARHVMVLPV